MVIKAWITHYPGGRMVSPVSGGDWRGFWVLVMLFLEVAAI